MKKNRAHIESYGMSGIIIRCYSDSHEECTFGEGDPKKKMRCMHAKYGGDMGEATCTCRPAREEALAERNAIDALEKI